jgi:glycine C-acetyltransferase
MEVSAAERTASNLLKWRSLHYSSGFKERVSSFSQFVSSLRANKEFTYKREVVSPTGREVTIKDYYTGEHRQMLMFASNNYLGLANHPYINEKVQQAISKYGAGLGGPPLFNGYTGLTRQLEERMADLKKKEAAIIFPSGYAANVGIAGALIGETERVLYDEKSHASFTDGLKLYKRLARSFKHNNAEDLARQLDLRDDAEETVFVGAEGVYSMNGDMAPLPELIAACKKKKNSIFILDDAHGTGVVGKKGAGTADYLGVSDDVDIIMGTFSKSFAVTGGFVTGSKDMIEFLRYFARPYVFSAAAAPPALAAILAGMDVMQNEPWLQVQLLKNVQYAVKKLSPFQIVSEPKGAIIALKMPEGMNIRRANYMFHELGLFINAIEYPAVPLKKQIFRISMTALHTEADIDYLAAAIEHVFANETVYDL